MFIDTLILLLLLVANGVFALSEIAVVSSRKAKLQGLAEGGNASAARALKLAEDPNRFLATVQIGITLVGIFAGAYGGATFAEPLGGVLEQVPLLAPFAQPLAFGLVVVLITYLSLVIGELVPKRVALTDPEGTAMTVAGFMTTLSRFTAPFVHVLTISTEGVLRLLRIRASDEPSISDEEINVLLQQGARAGVFEKSEQDIVENLFWLGDRQVSSVMTPRREIAWIDVGSDAEAIRQHLGRYPYSRFLVCEGSVDRVLGMIHTRDLLYHTLGGEAPDLRETLTHCLVVPETLPALRLLEQFRYDGIHLAVVIDEYGGTEGIVTLTDLLEGLVGQLNDLGEGDEAQATQREDGSWLLDGRLNIDDLGDILDLDIEPSGNYRTLGGFVMAQLRRIPKAADTFERYGWTFEVVDMDGNRVDKVLATPREPQGDDAA